ncbi:uncharacterized protein LOC126299301 [Schistocerca gregaria]|uniref:uncharacterized protein LOC126299301 n=1 Tax=Schistocerca gregaria TaxID=7010 RepID=UPI00211F17DF|nr:uncharacterized protein LOC126299301 [Schistocerca gregaria]
MAVFAVFLLLALAGARACEEQQRGTRGAPTPTPATSTDGPPTHTPAIDLSPVPPLRLRYVARRTEPSLYRYALLNAARLRDRGFERLRECCEEDPDGFCVCPDKLYAEAMQYEEYGAVERWFDECPEGRHELWPDGNGPLDYSLRRPPIIPSVSQVDTEQPNSYDWLKCTEAMPFETLPVSPTVTHLFRDRQAQPIVIQSSSRPISSVTCKPEPEDLSLQKWTPQSVSKYTMENVQIVPSSRSPPPVSDILPETSLYEGSERVMRNANQNHSYHSIWSAREIDAAQSLVSMLTSEVTIQVVNVESDNEPVPMDDDSDISHEAMQVDDGSDTSDESFVEVCSLGSYVAQEGTAESLSDQSSEIEVVNMTPDESMDVMDTTEPDDLDLGMEIDSNVPDIAAEVEVGTPMEQEEEAVIQQLQADVTTEQVSILQLPATPPEPRPALSGPWRPPSQPPPDISFRDYPGTRYSRDREPVIYSAVGYPGSEILGSFNHLKWMPPPPKDVNKQLDRIFGLQEEDKEELGLKMPELNHCLGELKYALYGTNVQPVYVVYVRCRPDPDNCLPPTVCSPVFSSVTVSRRKNVPFRHQVFKLMGDPHDEWEPAVLQVSTACFCSRPIYNPGTMTLFDIPPAT